MHDLAECLGSNDQLINSSQIREIFFIKNNKVLLMYFTDIPTIKKHFI